MTTPQVGGLVTTIEELDALPVGTIVANFSGGYDDQPLVYVKTGKTRWGLSLRYAFLPAVILYLPGHLPRPEREVQAEALRGWADAWDATLIVDGVLGPDEVSIEAAHARRRAARIAGGAV